MDPFFLGSGRRWVLLAVPELAVPELAVPELAIPKGTRKLLRVGNSRQLEGPAPSEESRTPFMFAFEKLPGLPRDRIVEAIAPVLRAHGLAGVELVWRTDGQGRVLQVTLESAAAVEGAAGESTPHETGPGAGVTLD